MATAIHWSQRGACKDSPPEWWTIADPSDHDGQHNNWRAVRICATCPAAIQRKCVQLALDTSAEGTIHGGIPFGRHVIARWRTCERPGCHGRWVTHPRNRQRLYCSAYCRKATEEARRAAVQRSRRTKQRAREAKQRARDLVDGEAA